MFRRKWSALPEDPKFEPDLFKLGYFINNVDEIRNIEEPKFYYQFFINKNDRWNERQRFAFYEALEKIIRTRFQAAGLSTVRLPLGAGPTDAHVPILATSDLPRRPRVVVFVGESIQDLGVLAYRVVSGRGGVNEGTLLRFADLLSATQRCSAADPTTPGLVVANTGQLWWWPEGGRALNKWSRDAVPMPSAAHLGYLAGEQNVVPGNRDVEGHVAYVFDEVLPRLASRDAKIDVIGVLDGCDAVQAYLDREEKWKVWGHRLSSLAILGGSFSVNNCRVEGFQAFIRKRGRAYVISPAPLDTPIAGPGGNPRVATFTSYGCPVFSSGEAVVDELIMIKARDSVLRWIQEVALGGDNYCNPDLEFVDYADDVDGEDESGLFGPANDEVDCADGDGGLGSVEEWGEEEKLGNGLEPKP